tara:strand:+ start:3337 stop:3537 length:201 start_codon:yes stop_codon:yes gene_type:complete
MDRKRRTKRQKAILNKKIVEYYFANPHANGFKLIEDKFDVDEGTIRNVLSKELKRRFENAQRIRNL